MMSGMAQPHALSALALAILILACAVGTAVGELTQIRGTYPSRAHRSILHAIPEVHQTWCDSSHALNKLSIKLSLVIY